MEDAEAMVDDMLLKGRLTILQLLLDKRFKNVADTFLLSMKMITEDESSAEIMSSTFKNLQQLLLSEKTFASFKEIVDGLRQLLTNKQASKTLVAILNSIAKIATLPGIVKLINNKFDLAIMFAKAYRGSEIMSAISDGLVTIMQSDDPKHSYIKAFTNAKKILSTNLSTKFRRFFTG